MTTPPEPDQPNYGDGQQGLPSFPAAPEANEMRQQSYPPPTEITAAFWCYLVGAVITVVGGLLVLAARQTIVDATRAANTTNVPDSEIQQLANFAVGVAVVLSLIIAGLYAFFAFKLRAGRNWARIVLTIVAALALLSLLLGGSSASPLRWIGDLAAIVGAVLSYLPNSSAYIAATKRVN
jgi:hypothetical protein